MSDTPKTDKFAFGFAKPNTGDGVEICHHTNEEWRVFAGELERKAAVLDWLEQKDGIVARGFVFKWFSEDGQPLLSAIEAAMKEAK